MRSVLFASSLILVLSSGCGLLGGGGGAAPESACAFNGELASLAGTTWVMDEAIPGGNRLNPQARMQFFQDGDALKVRYNVKSNVNMYTYNCEPNTAGTEVSCAEPPKPVDWCQTLEVAKAGSCTVEALKSFGAKGLSDDELAAAVKSAKETVDKARKTENWKQFSLANNNLGNKLQGLLFAKPDAKRCSIRAQDMYMTLYNGKRVEDSNPVGTNPFAPSTDKLLWESCDSGNVLADAMAADKPKVEEVGMGVFQHETGKSVFYHYYGDKALKPEPGCTYSYDAYAQWKLANEGVAVATGADGKLVWTAEHAFSADEHPEGIDPNMPQGVFHMVRYQTCGGERKKIDTICNIAKVMPVD